MMVMEIRSLILGQRVCKDSSNLWRVMLEDGTDFQIIMERVHLKVDEDCMLVSPLKHTKAQRRGFASLERKLYELLLPRIKVKVDEWLRTMLKMYTMTDDGDIQYHFKIGNFEEFKDVIKDNVEYDVTLCIDCIRVTKSKVDVIWTLHDATRHTSLILDDNVHDDEDVPIHVPDPEPDETEIENIRQTVFDAILSEQDKLIHDIENIQKLQNVLGTIKSYYDDSSKQFSLENLNHITACIEQFGKLKRRMLE